MLLLISCGKQDESSAKLSDIQFKEIDADLSTWDLTRGSGDELKKHLAESLVAKILMIGAAKPQVSLLNTASIETICKLTLPEYQFIYEFNRSKEFAKLAYNYLLAIKDQSATRLVELQRTFGGQGCQVLKK